MEGLWRVQEALGSALEGLRPAGWGDLVVYDPATYASQPYRTYCRRFAAPPKEALFLGMNPGPWGMAQTGIPFGDVGMVRDWLGITGRVDPPRRTHPRRPVEGFSCRRGEGSGRRLWGWARERFGSPERFFARFFVVNYCPLAFFRGASAENVTPDHLPPHLKEAVFPPCDRALQAVVQRLSPRWVFGLGNFAAERARIALAGYPVHVGRLLHPSPASPAANRGWAEAVERELELAGVDLLR